MDLTGTRRSDKIKDVSEGTNKEKRQAADLKDSAQRSVASPSESEYTMDTPTQTYRGSIDICQEWQALAPYSQEARDLDDECRERTGMGCHALIEGMRQLLAPMEG